MSNNVKNEYQFTAIERKAFELILDMRKEIKNLKTKMSYPETTEEERTEAIERCKAIDLYMRDLFNLINK